MNAETTLQSRILLVALIVGSCLALDQWTKRLAEQHLKPGPMQQTEVHSYLGDTFRLTFAYNKGAFLGMGRTLSPRTRFWLLTGMNSLFLLVIVIVMIVKWRMPRLAFISLCLLLAGGVGNLIDRITQDGMVTDFLNVGIGGLRTGIFNIADMAIMAGAGILIVLSFREDTRKKREQAVSTTEAAA